jgi:hypothetical protein
MYDKSYMMGAPDSPVFPPRELGARKPQIFKRKLLKLTFFGNRVIVDQPYCHMIPKGLWR